MSEKKIVVPEGMLFAAVEAMQVPSGPRFRSTKDWANCGLEAALRWLAEHPVVPTGEELKEWLHGVDALTPNIAREFLCQFQRRMFLALEPEVPEAVKDLLWAGRKVNPLVSDSPDALQMQHDLWIIEAYRRGQKEGK